MEKIKKFGVSQTITAPKKVEKLLRALIKNPPSSAKKLEKFKCDFSAQEKISPIQNRELIVTAQKLNLKLPKTLEKLIQKRSVRTISGVSPIGVLTKPYPCPGQCVYCPTEARMPKSYLKKQPAAARAFRNKFHPYTQVKNRIVALKESGHPVSKLELIVMGGTWSFLPKRYQTWFVKKLFEGANTTASDLQFKSLEKLTTKEWQQVLKMEQIVLKDIGFENSYQITNFKEALKYSEQYWIGFLKEKIVAMGGFIKKDSKTADLWRVRVHPAFQNKGLGKQMVQKIINEIEAQKFKRITLYFTDTLRFKNKPFYEKLGFKEYKRGFYQGYNRLFLQKKVKPKTLREVQKINETAKQKIIGLTLETRPDFITEKELKRMRELGCTRIEIGVQTLDDDVHKLTKRGHARRHIVQAMKLMKNYGFKVCFHLMPGLPGSNPKKDLKWMKEVFENQEFKPDFVKVYPCLVLPNSELKQWWEEGKYTPYDDKTLIKLLIQWQAFVPEWTRIMRLMRDIPVKHILDGAQFSNLRQILNDQPQKLKEIVGDNFYEANNLANKKLFRDIRAREIGFSKKNKTLTSPVLKRRDYKASDGEEVFLSFETEDEAHLFALLRLRKPGNNNQDIKNFRSVLKNAALIREVHSYGSEVSVGEGEGVGQHRGLGKKLLQEAERIAQDEWGMKKITIIAGVGTREYYRKFGYQLRATYMTKFL